MCTLIKQQIDHQVEQGSAVRCAPAAAAVVLIAASQVNEDCHASTKATLVL
jgi:hypothetical protein